MTGVSSSDPARDFDFLVGRWHVGHRSLRRRLDGCSDWLAFTGTCEMRLLLGGHANVDDNVIESPAGPYRAASLRAFDPATRQWSIWWLDGRRPDGLGVPVRGAFVDGVGRFHADDEHDGKPIRVRFEWSRITTASATWEQSFSADGGRSWEANWRMDFKRA